MHNGSHTEWEGFDNVIIDSLLFVASFILFIVTFMFNDRYHNLKYLSGIQN